MFLVGDGDRGATGVMGEVGRNSDASEAAGLSITGSRIAVTAEYALYMSSCRDCGAWWKLCTRGKKESVSTLQETMRHRRGWDFTYSGCAGQKGRGGPKGQSDPSLQKGCKIRGLPSEARSFQQLPGCRDCDFLAGRPGCSCFPRMKERDD